MFAENELKIIQTFDSIYFRGKSHFEEDGTQNYLVFQPMYSILKELVMETIFIFRNPRDCLMKILQGYVLFLIVRNCSFFLWASSFAVALL